MKTTVDDVIGEEKNINSNLFEFDGDEKKTVCFSMLSSNQKSCNELCDTKQRDNFVPATFRKNCAWPLERNENDKMVRANSVATLFDCLWTTDTVTTIYRHS